MNKSKYLNYLIKLIPSLINLVNKTYPNSLLIAKTNYTNVISKALYYDLLNNDEIKNLAQESSLNPDIEVIETVFSLVEQKYLYLKYRQFLKNMRIIFMLIFSKRDGSDLKDKYVFFIKEDMNQEKFIRFIKPLIEQLENRYIILGSGKSFVKYCKKHNLIYSVLPKKRFLKNAIPDIFSPYEYLFQLFEQVDRWSQINNPKKFIVLEGNAPHDEVINLVGKKNGVPVICIQQGWSPIIHTGFRNLSFTKMLVWGEGFSSLLKPYSPEQHFVATGNFHVKNLTNDKTIKDDIVFFTQPINPMLESKSYLEFFDFIYWTAENYKNKSIVVRPHPNDHLSKDQINKINSYKNIMLKPSEKHPLSEALKNAVVSVSIYSSTILESVASNVIPLIFNNTDMPKYNPDLDSEKAAIEVKNIDDAKLALNKILLNPDSFSLEVTKNKYFYKLGGDALQATLSEIV